MYMRRQEKEDVYCVSRGRIKVCDFSLPVYSRPLLLTCVQLRKKKNVIFHLSLTVFLLLPFP